VGSIRKKLGYLRAYAHEPNYRMVVEILEHYFGYIIIGV